MYKGVYIALLVPLVLHADVTMYRGRSFRLPRTCKHLAILGSTPHPTQYLTQGGAIKDLKNITLADFLDVEYLRDSLRSTLQLCMKNNVDHLLIAYLPAHFVAQRTVYRLSVYERCIRAFVKRIGSQVADLIRSVAREMGSEISVTLVLPTRKALRTVPFAFDSDEHRIQHYIRTFPRLKGIADKPFKLSIINNRNSDQNDAIMKYLSYEYVLQQPLHCTVLELDKEKFHRYIP